MKRGRISWALTGCLWVACTTERSPVLAGELEPETEVATGEGLGSTSMATPDGMTGEGSTGLETDSVGDSGEEGAASSGCTPGTEGCSCADGDTCEEGLECKEPGTCEVRSECPSIEDEAHGDETSALRIDGLYCGGIRDLGVYGTLDSAGSDWYRYNGSAEVFCAEQPRVLISSDVETEVCVFIECEEGDVGSVECFGEYEFSLSSNDRPGCCGDGQARIEDYECVGGFMSKNVGVWISVTPDESVCVDYGLAYGF